MVVSGSKQTLRQGRRWCFCRGGTSTEEDDSAFAEGVGGQTGQFNIRPMNTALEELHRAALRVKEKLNDAIRRVQSRLGRGRRKTLVETRFYNLVLLYGIARTRVRTSIQSAVLVQAAAIFRQRSISARGYPGWADKLAYFILT